MGTRACMSVMCNSPTVGTNCCGGRRAVRSTVAAPSVGACRPRAAGAPPGGPPAADGPGCNYSAEDGVREVGGTKQVSAAGVGVVRCCKSVARFAPHRTRPATRMTSQNARRPCSGKASRGACAAEAAIARNSYYCAAPLPPPPPPTSLPSASPARHARCTVAARA
jgi:hypothetical protein